MARSISVKPRVVFVIGYAACGKTTFVRTLMRDGDGVCVEPGELVRLMSRRVGRVFDHTYDDPIVEYIKDTINRTQCQVVVSSPRSLHIVRSIVEYVGKENVRIYVLDVPYDERVRRYGERCSEKDTGLTYDDVLAGDDRLGMSELMRWCSENPDGCDIERVEW